VIGENLISLEIGQATEYVLGMILDYCVNLQYLELYGASFNEESVDAIKNGLTGLVKLKMNGQSIRLD
jgi:hypothetical protein